MRGGCGYKKMIKSSKIYKMRIVFSTRGKRVQHDVFKAVREMILASGLPFEPAKINAKWPRFSYGPSLPEHQTASREYVDIYLSAFVAAEEVKRKLQAALPEEVSILEVRRVPYALPSVQNLAAAAIFSVEGNFEDFTLQQTVENYFNTPRVEVAYMGQNGFTITKNIKPYVREAKMLTPRKMQLTLSCVDGKWIQPQEALAGYLGIAVPFSQEAWTVDGFTFVREGLYWQDSQGELHLI